MNLPKMFESDNIVYHYTKSITAVEYILFSKKLRLSHRKNSIDPIENGEICFSKTSIPRSEEEDQYINNQKWNDALEIENFYRSNYEKAKQVCFCMNQDEEDYMDGSIKPYEYFGCMKPRMWDQYADNYNGVCLVFSLKKILEKLPTDYLHSSVEYVDYSTLRNNQNTLVLNEIYNKDQVITEYKDKLKRVLFRKHSDYSGENEYRICSFSDNVFDYIDISDALLGVVGSDKNSAFCKSQLAKYAKDFKIEYREILWSNDGINISKPNDSIVDMPSYLNNLNI